MTYLTDRILRLSRRLLKTAAATSALALPLLTGMAGAQTATTSGSSGSYCTAVYGVGGNTVTFFNTFNSTFSNLTTNTQASDINAAAVDKTNGRLYYIDRSNSTVWYYDPIAQRHVRVGSFTPPSNSSALLVAGAMDEQGIYYIYYSTGEFATINKATGQASPFRRLTYSGVPSLSSSTNGDMAFNGDTAYAIYQTGSNRVSNIFRINTATGVLSTPVALTLNGVPVIASDNGGINGLAYEPVSGNFFVSTSGQGGAPDGFYQLDVNSGAITLRNSISGVNDLASCSRPRPFPPAITKSFNPTTATGAPARTRLTLSLTNPNEAPYFLIADLVDRLPSVTGGQMAVATTPNIGGSCPVNSVVATGTTVTLRTGMTVPVGGCTVSVDVTAPVAGTYVNTIAAGDLKTTVGNNAMPTSATLTVAPSTDLSVFKDLDLSNSRDPKLSKFYVGDRVGYTLSATNNGPVNANNATLKDVAEAGLEDVRWTCTASGGAQCPAASGTGFPNFTIPVFPVGGSIVVKYTALVTREDGQLTNTVTIAPPAGIVDSNPANNTDSVFICSVLPARLTVAKVSNGPWTALQSGATYTLTVRNTGGVATSGVVTVRDQLPVGVGAALTSGFAPATGWECRYSGEAEQSRGTGLNPNEAQLLTCTTSTVLAPGATVTLTIPVNVTPLAGQTVTNKASIGGGGDPDPIPDPATCATTTEQCAENTTPVTPQPAPPITCPVGTATNLFASPLSGYADADRTVQNTAATLIGTFSSFTLGTGQAGRFVVDGSYFFNNGYSSSNSASNDSTLQLVVNGTVYATFVTEDGYSGRATVTAQNGATLMGGAASLQLNRISTSRIWVTLPASVTSISGVVVRFTSTSPVAAEPSDDYGFTVNSILGCVRPMPVANVTKTVQNITAGGAVGTTGTGKPGDVLEYCIVTLNSGTAGATNITFGDTVPANTTFRTGAYGAGRDIRVTLPTGTQFYTAASDADPASLVNGRVNYSGGTFVLAPTQTVTVCFRAAIN